MRHAITTGFFLIQPAPLPERLIGSDPEFYLRAKIGAWSKGGTHAFDEEALAEYIRCFNNPDCIAASCEDYRAAATIDLHHDAADGANRLETPVLALWGAEGVVGHLYDVMDVWRATRKWLMVLPCRVGIFCRRKSRRGPHPRWRISSPETCAVGSEGSSLTAVPIRTVNAGQQLVIPRVSLPPPGARRETGNTLAPAA